MNARIKKLRKSLDLTQAEFAKRIGSTQNTITGYESGNRNPSNAVINNICKEFNVNEEWLRDGIGEMFRSSPEYALDAIADEYHLTQNECAFVEKFVKMKPEKRKVVIDFFVGVVATLSSEPSHAPPQSLEDEADAYAKMISEKSREQFLEEKKMESQAFFVKESDVV